MADGPVRWGILSTADINSLFIPGLKGSSRAELVAIASRTQERADAFAAKWEIPRAHGSYQALLADPEVEAVYIPLPNTLHCPWSIEAVEAGKHVLCEKPLARDPQQVAATFDAAERAGRLFMEAFMFRHHPQTAKLVELVRSGSIGELRLIRSSFSYGLFDPDDIRLKPELEGGGLMDVGCYNVSASRLLAGEPERVFGEAWFGPTGTDWVLAGTMRHPGDVITSFECGTGLTDREALEAVGAEGSLFLADPWHCVRPAIELRRGSGSVERIEIEPLDAYTLEVENLSDAIRGNGTPLLGRDDAVAQARTLQALHASATTAAPVSL